MKASLNNTSDQVYVNLDKEKPVRFINLLQTYWATETEIADTILKECASYSNRDAPGKGCVGSVRSCQSVIRNGDTVYTYQKSSQVDRIYEGYSIRPKSYYDNTRYYGKKVDGSDRSIKWEIRVSKISIQISSIKIIHILFPDKRKLIFSYQRCLPLHMRSVQEHKIDSHDLRWTDQSSKRFVNIYPSFL